MKKASLYNPKTKNRKQQQPEHQASSQRELSQVESKPE